MYYCALSLGDWSIFPDFLSFVRLGVFWGTFSVNFLLRKNNYLNNIDMLLLRTSYRYRGFLDTRSILELQLILQF